MPIVKIIQKGWETFNGHLEGIQFENAVSTEPLNDSSAERLGSMVKLIDVETGKIVSATQRLLDSKRMSVAPGSRVATKREIISDKVKTPAPAKTVAEKVEKEMDFTREQIESIADKGGITLLREFAKEYNVNGVSVVGIIDALMAKQAKTKAKAEAK